MSSYHDSFTYKNKNSLKDMNLIITSFEPDEGFTETFLSMDQVFEENYDGTRQFSYGARYNSTANINITLIKRDCSDFSIQDFRNCAKWLTGARVDSWLDMYVGPNVDENGNNITDNIVYSFLGKITDLQQYKLDSRTIGIQVVFSSVTPWAFSQPISEDRDFGQKIFVINDDSTYDDYLYVGSIDNPTLTIDDNGILHASPDNTQHFSFMDKEVYDNVIYIDNTVVLPIDNKTDDLYTYINLDMKLTNEDSEYLSVKNKYQSIDGETIEEETKIINMVKDEVILLSSDQFITSENNPKKIFGDNFNFIWPKLAPGMNEFSISGSGAGNVQFTYRYPMKVGDCTMDTGTSMSGINCGDYPQSGDIEFTGTIEWDKITNKPDTIQGYLIDDEVYTKEEIDKMFDGVTADDLTIDEEELNAMLEDTLK